MKRKTPSDLPVSELKRQAKKAKGPEYHETPSVYDEETGEKIWPAPREMMEDARGIIRECAHAEAPVLICPDKDADGLTAGTILHRTLTALGLPSELISVHFLPKGESIHSDSQRGELTNHFLRCCTTAGDLENPLNARDAQPGHVQPTSGYLLVLDQGTQPSPSLINSHPHLNIKTLIIDHHHAILPLSTAFPLQSTAVTASHSPPVVTASLLTHLLCTPLHPSIHPSTAYLACIGTHADLGTSFKWSPPFPDMSPTLSERPNSRKAVNDAVSHLNAPRRTAAYDVPSAWHALQHSRTAADVLDSAANPHSTRLADARAEVNREVSRCFAAAPKFSVDGTVALVRIASPCQVHPVVATRWAGTLKAKKLRFVICANEAWLPGRVCFSCRVAKSSVQKRREDGVLGGDGGEGEVEEVNIIASLRDIAARHDSGDLLARLGRHFGTGHVQASGGIVGKGEFEELMSVLRIGERPEREEKVSPGKRMGSGQKNTLEIYFGNKVS